MFLFFPWEPLLEWREDYFIGVVLADWLAVQSELAVARLPAPGD
jgi:hypothetical protein